MTSARSTEHRIRLADERTLACLELGDPKGAPVIYFHGFPGSRLEARLAADVAQRLGLRLFAPDRPGFGESTFLPDRTIGNWAADVTELTDQLGLQRFAVVGVSGGGPYALACAVRIPERLHGVALVGALGPLAGMRSTRGMLARNRLALALAARSPALVRLVIELAPRWIRRRPARFIARMAADAPFSPMRVTGQFSVQALRRHCGRAVTVPPSSLHCWPGPGTSGCRRYLYRCGSGKG